MADWLSPPSLPRPNLSHSRAPGQLPTTDRLQAVLTFRQLAGLLCCPTREDFGEHALTIGAWLAGRSPWGPSRPGSGLHA